MLSPMIPLVHCTVGILRRFTETQRYSTLDCYALRDLILNLKRKTLVKREFFAVPSYGLL